MLHTDNVHVSVGRVVVNTISIDYRSDTLCYRPICFSFYRINVVNDRSKQYMEEYTIPVRRVLDYRLYIPKFLQGVSVSCAPLFIINSAKISALIIYM